MLTKFQGNSTVADISQEMKTVWPEVHLSEVLPPLCVQLCIQSKILRNSDSGHVLEITANKLT